LRGIRAPQSGLTILSVDGLFCVPKSADNGFITELKAELPEPGLKRLFGHKGQTAYGERE